MPTISFPLLFFGIRIVSFVAHKWTQMLALDFQTPDSPRSFTGGPASHSTLPLLAVGRLLPSLGCCLSEGLASWTVSASVPDHIAFPGGGRRCRECPDSPELMLLQYLFLRIITW